VTSPEWQRADPQSAFGLKFEAVTFQTSDGIDVHGWLVPAKGKSAVAFVHGRGGSRHMALLLIESLHAAGIDSLSFDVRGHGQTAEHRTGSAFLEGWRDVVAAVRFLREGRGFERVGIFGGSQGASSATLAVGREGGGDALVAVSGATSMYGLLRGLQMLKWVPDWEIWLISSLALYRLGASFEMATSPRSGPIDVIGDVAPIPVLIVHGDADPLVAVSEARELFAAAREPKELWIIPGRGHEDIADGPEFARRVTSFFSENLSSPARNLRSR
jgi:alpha-beta hydrolase superfamily lysophospholipase